jgi:hypothetical protein
MTATTDFLAGPLTARRGSSQKRSSLVEQRFSTCALPPRGPPSRRVTGVLAPGHGVLASRRQTTSSGVACCASSTGIDARGYGHFNRGRFERRSLTDNGLVHHDPRGNLQQPGEFSQRLPSSDSARCRMALGSSTLDSAGAWTAVTRARPEMARESLVTRPDSRPGPH